MYVDDFNVIFVFDGCIIISSEYITNRRKTFLYFDVMVKYNIVSSKMFTPAIFTNTYNLMLQEKRIQIKGKTGVKN